MSGEKCAKATLTAEARAAIEREFNRSRALVAVLANAANLVRQAESLEVERYLQGEINEGFRKKLETLNAQIESFRGSMRKLQAALDRLMALRSKVEWVNSDQALATSMRQDAESVAAEVERRMPEIETLISSTSERLEQEQQSAQYSAQKESERNRRTLKGLLGELQWRANPALPCSLSLVYTGAQKFEIDLNAAITGSKHITDADVDQFRSKFQELIKEAEQVERKRAEHRSLAQTLDRAFQNAGFKRVHEDTIEAGNLIVFQHRANSQTLHVKVDSRVNQDGHINLLMEGASGSGTAKMTAHNGCIGDIESVIAQAQALGLIIDDVIWKDPGGDWKSLKIRNVAPAKTANQVEHTHTEAQTWKPQSGG